MVVPDGDNAFYGGSGNDTMVGVEGDDFTGGSARNETIAAAPGPRSVIALTFEPWERLCMVGVELTGFAPETMYTVTEKRDQGVLCIQGLGT